MGSIYKITSIIKPYRIYIGSAVNFKARKAIHVSQLKSNKHGNNVLQRHFNKYGIEDLVFEIIESVENNNTLLKREQYYIDMLSPKFNLCVTAGSNLGRKFGAMKTEHKNKISNSNKGKLRPGTSINNSKKLYKYSLDGHLISVYKNSIEAAAKTGLRVRKLSAVNKTIGGFVWLTEDCSAPDFNEIRKSLIDCKKVLNKPVLQIDVNGNIINEFDGVRIASKETGIDHRSIQSVAAGSNPKRHKAGGFFWKYKQVA